jgi:hypothetical protein
MIKYTTREKIFRALFILVLIPVVALAGWCGYIIYDNSETRTGLKNDFAEINNIQYGLLSVDRWRDNIQEIVNTQIEEFQFSDIQEDTLKTEINKILNSLITQADDMINEKQKDFKGKVKKIAFNTFIDVDNIRERVPEFSQTIINQLKKPKSQQKLKFLAEDKLNEFAEQTRDSIANEAYDNLLRKYHVQNSEELSAITIDRAERLQQENYNYSFVIIGIMLFFLLMWYLMRNQAVLQTPMFTLSVLFALCVLFAGLTCPMIEIDARIQEINFMLIGKSIQFHDQVLFYQSKSILDVVMILIRTGKADSVFVGVLILMFSIVFPVTKLLSTKIYLLGSEKIRRSPFIKFFAFKSGKWSMADVMVVAIFMAFIGFKGILDSQVVNMNTQMNNRYVASIATNKTSLEPGFILFISFVLFGLVLSVILKRISPDKSKVTVAVTS